MSSAPSVQTLPRLRHSGRPGPAGWSGERVFDVYGGAPRSGRAPRQGDVVLTAGEARPGDRVVLVPRKRGFPMFGRLERDGLVAEPSGAPCSALRWRAAGRVVAVVRRRPSRGALIRADAPSGVGAVALATGQVPLADVLAAVADRLPGARPVAEDLIVADGVAGASVLAEWLAVELEERFGWRLAVAAGTGCEAASRAVNLAAPGQVVFVEPGAEDFLPAVPGVGLPQLGLFASASAA